MATWDTSQYDDILNDARRMAEIEYTRQRQAVLDKRAAQDHELRYESDLRKAEKEKDEFEQYKRELPVRNQLADWKLQQETNKMIQEQAKESYKHITPEQRSLLNILANGTATNIKFKGIDYGPASTLTQNQIRRFGLNPFWVQMHKNALEEKAAKEKAEQQKQADAEKKAKLAKAAEELTTIKMQNEINKQQIIADTNQFKNQNRSFKDNAIYKVLSGVPLNKKEKEFLENYYPLRTIGLDYNEITLPVEEYVKRLYKEDPKNEDFKNINPRLFSFFQENYAIKREKEKKEEYESIRSKMIGLYNKYNTDDKFNRDQMESIVKAATSIYLKGGISEDEAMKQAMGKGDSSEYGTPEEMLFRQHGTKYTDLSEEQKEKLLYAFNEYNKRRVKLYSQIPQGDLVKEHDALLELEKFWEIAMDQAGIKGITSPFYQRFMQLDNADVL